MKNITLSRKSNRKLKNRCYDAKCSTNNENSQSFQRYENTIEKNPNNYSETLCFSNFPFKKTKESFNFMKTKDSQSRK